jgi:hypothetical protein
MGCVKLAVVADIGVDIHSYPHHGLPYQAHTSNGLVRKAMLFKILSGSLSEII